MHDESVRGHCTNERRVRKRDKAQNPLRQFPRNFPVYTGKVPTCYGLVVYVADRKRICYGHARGSGEKLV